MPPTPAVYPFTLRLAADARTGRTTYADDQSWEIALGQGEQPALALQTRYGGRVGLLRLVPMLRLQSEAIYEAQQFAKPFQLTLLAPDALRLEAMVSESLSVAWFVWVIHSQAVGGSFIFTNQSTQPITLNTELFAQAMREQQNIPMQWLELETPQGKEVGLALGNIGNLQPVLLMEQGQENSTTRIRAGVTIPAGKNATVRFCLASFTDMNASLEEAYRGLYQTDWNAAVKAINQRGASLPSIETGDANLDAAIALSQQTALRSLIGKTDQFPFPSPVFVRVPAMGYSPNGTGADHIRPWEGQNALDTLQFASTLAPLDASLVKGLVKNYLVGQASEGFVDAIPGAGGQKSGVLLAPMLAQLTDLAYIYSRDESFVAEVYPRLLQFYAYWFKQDADNDGFPEWQTALQANVDYHPLFRALHQNAQTALVALLESPDLASYLLREGQAMEKLAPIAKQQKNWQKVRPFHEKLKTSLQESWQDNQFIYRERDSHQLMAGDVLFKAKGDLRLGTTVTLPVPGTVVIEILGGASKPKSLKATVEGFDKNGQHVIETLDDPAFQWYRARGAALSRTTWQKIDSVAVDGLSRVYEYEVKTLDIRQRDLSLLLPYTTGLLTDAQTRSVLKDLKEKYWWDYGLATAETPLRDDLHHRMVLVWVTLLGVALLAQGEARLSAELFEKVTAAQVKILQDQGGFFQWIDAETGSGLGLMEHTMGLVPLHWLMELIGVRVINSQTVELVREFALKKKVTLMQHGVKIARSSRKLTIKFPGGAALEFAADAAPQLVHDPQMVTTSPKRINKDQP